MYYNLALSYWGNSSADYVVRTTDFGGVTVASGSLDHCLEFMRTHIKPRG